MAYATADQVIDRIGDEGARLLVDRDGSGAISSAELAHITTECGEASRFIDAHLATYFSVPLTGSAANNQTLNDWCIWLVIESLAARLTAVPLPWQVKAQMVRDNLERVRTGQLRVPGLTYPGDGFTTERRAIGRPVVANPPRRRR